MALALSRRSALRLGGSALLLALVPVPLDLGRRSRRLPLTPVLDGVEVAVPPDFLAGLAPGGCSQWAAFRAFDRPVLILFPALDMKTVESLVEALFGATDRITTELLTSLVLADAREVMQGDRPFGIATLDHDLVAHAGLSDVVELVQFPGHGLLRTPSADGIRPNHTPIARR